MRTLTAEATAEQKKNSYTPFIQAVFRSHDGATTRTYNQKSTSIPHIWSVSQAEGRLGGRLSSTKVPFPISAIIRLNDPSNSLSSTSFIGYRCDIGWGINTAANGDEISEGEPLIVVQQSEVGMEGSVFLELTCASLFDFYSIIWAAQARSNPFIYDGEQVKQILMEMLGGAILENLGDEYLSGTIVGWDAGEEDYTDESADLKDFVTIQGLQNYVDTASSKIYFGVGRRFNRLTVYMTTLGAGTFAITWEYWNGSGWAALSNVASSALTGSANGANFKGLGVYIISFDLPSNMSNTNGNFRTQNPGDGTSTVFPAANLYWVRARQTVSSPDVDTAPIATTIQVALDMGLSIDTTVATQGDDETPRYTTSDGQTALDVITDILNYTTMGIVLKQDGFHAKYINETLPSADYTYVIPSDGSNHAAFEVQVDIYEILPNRVTYTNVAGDSNVAFSANDTDSQAAYGVVEEQTQDETVKTIGKAEDLADRRLARLQRDTAQGRFTAPMNIAQEIWDTVLVQDSRTGENKTGRVVQILREWEPGHYLITVVMGRAEESWLYRTANPLNTTSLRSGSLNEGILNFRSLYMNVDARITAGLQAGGINPLGVPVPSDFLPSPQPGGRLIGDPSRGIDIGPGPAGPGSPGGDNIPGAGGINAGDQAPRGRFGGGMDLPSGIEVARWFEGLPSEIFQQHQALAEARKFKGSMTKQQKALIAAQTLAARTQALPLSEDIGDGI